MGRAICRRERHWGKMGEGRKERNGDDRDGLVYICKISRVDSGERITNGKVKMTLIKRSQ
jgi:hypothetical protein